MSSSLGFCSSKLLCPRCYSVYKTEFDDLLLVAALKDIGSHNTKPCPASSLLTTPGKKYAYWAENGVSPNVLLQFGRTVTHRWEGWAMRWMNHLLWMQASRHLSMNCYLNCSTINYHIRENLASLLQKFSKLSIKHFKIKNIYYSCYFHIYFSLENENRSRSSLVLKQDISYFSQKSVHGRAII